MYSITILQNILINLILLYFKYFIHIALLFLILNRNYRLFKYLHLQIINYQRMKYPYIFYISL